MDQRKEMAQVVSDASKLNQRSAVLLRSGLALKRKIDSIKKRNAQVAHIKSLGVKKRPS
jgi:hypothetical protein